MLKKLTIVILILTFAGSIEAQDEDVPRYEIGGQFTVISRNKPTLLSPDIIIVPDDFEDVMRFGAGARFTYNLNRCVALEAEMNFFPSTDKDRGVNVPGGGIIQAQFGVKA